MTVPVPRYLPRAVRLALARYNAGAAVAIPRFLPRPVRNLLDAINDRLGDPSPGDLPVVRGLPRAVRVAGAAVDTELDVLTPIALADFQNGIYQINGDASSLAAMFPEESDDWPWEHSRVVPGQGFTHRRSDGGSSVYAGFGSWVSSIVPSAGGFTFVADIETTGVYLSFLLALYDAPSYNTEWDITSEGIYSGVGADYANDPSFPGNVRIAATVSSTVFAASRNGGVAITDLPAQSANLDAAWVGVASSVQNTVNDKVILKKLTFYPPQSASDLPALSALS
jgi:hypothetical protein